MNPPPTPLGLYRSWTGLFYGWHIVGAGMGMQILVGALLMQSYSQYSAILSKEFAWSATTFSLAFAMTRVESGLLGPLQGWGIDRFGPRAMMRLGVVFFGVGLMLFSQLDSQFTFFLFFFFMAVGSSLAGFMTLTTAVVNWFERRRATALAVMALGIAIGGQLVPVVTVALEQFGWRSTAFVSGWIVLVLGLPLAQVVRRRPEDYGLLVDGARPSTLGVRAPSQSPTAAPRPDFTTREALRAPAFWYISLGHASALLVVSAVMVHLTLHVTQNLGYSLTTAAFVIALMTGVQIIGMLAGGLLGDRFDKRVIVVVCMGGHALGMLLLAYASSLWMVFLFAIVHGLAWGGRGPLMQAIRADYFGRTSFAKIMGFSSLIVMMGMTIGPIVAGVLADATGNYQLGFTVLAIAAGLGSIFFVLAKPPKPPNRPAPRDVAAPRPLTTEPSPGAR